MNSNEPTDAALENSIIAILQVAPASHSSIMACLGAKETNGRWLFGIATESQVKRVRASMNKRGLISMTNDEFCDWYLVR